MTTSTPNKQKPGEDRRVLRLPRALSHTPRKRAAKRDLDDGQMEPEDERAYQVLIDAALERGNEVDLDPLRDVEWVYACLAVPWSEINVNTVPSTGALGLLKASKDNSRWFFDKYHLKFMPIRIDSDGESEPPEDEDDLDAAELIAASGLLNDEELRNLGLSNDRPVTSP